MKHKKYQYKIIENDLREKIKSGYYKIGENLPREVDLAEDYGVSRPTVRKAIEGLVDDGMLARKKRAGTRVISKKITSNFTNMIESYDEDIKKNRSIPNTSVINFQETKADEEIADYLNLELDEPVYKLARLRFADQDPTVYVTTYIPVEIAPNLKQYDFSKVSLYDTLANINNPVTRVERILEVVMPDSVISALLNIDESQPCFHFTTIGYNKDNQAIEYSIAYYRGDLNSFKIVIEN